MRLEVSSEIGFLKSSEMAIFILRSPQVHSMVIADEAGRTLVKILKVSCSNLLVRAWASSLSISRIRKRSKNPADTLSYISSEGSLRTMWSDCTASSLPQVALIWQ